MKQVVVEKLYGTWGCGCQWVEVRHNAIPVYFDLMSRGAACKETHKVVVQTVEVPSS